jgi:transcriptional regulator with XRE-family HTH domain
MELPKYIHGHEENLPNTLGSRVLFLRNSRRLHIAELSNQARVSIKMLEDIEAGIETWLPTSVRQRIARVLKVDPNILEEVEIKKSYTAEEEIKYPPYEVIERIQEQILSGDLNILCPVCKNPLRVWVQEGFDLNSEPIRSAKGHCTECVFQLRS